MTEEQIEEFQKKFGAGPDVRAKAHETSDIDLMQKNLNIANQRIEILEARTRRLTEMHAKLANDYTQIKNKLLH